MNYRGRLAPSPTGYLHAGHAATFRVAADRAREAGGTLVLRMEDIDAGRCRPEYVLACMQDLRLLGIKWSEGPDTGGLYAPYTQSERFPLYRMALDKLRRAGLVYPCHCSRRDIQHSLAAPHEGGDDVLYPGTCRPQTSEPSAEPIEGVTWRFLAPVGRRIVFEDNGIGRQEFVVGEDFGDFPVWRKDNLPAYQLAVVVDDAAMQITEVVRGADLLVSTARQLLLYEALELPVPSFFHCPLIRDKGGERLSKSAGARPLQSRD